ncbi:type II secretion system F family protein [Natranaerobius thermophilus]|uniref:Type II secretion system protein n=1 Tax=Natranaerobius thermophilus (strain ATCC BAA-1301 / DSM 18059 / JW/NM-WN-LF) TaxID=457570 RepID=B2A562_NATTJ|nr:type II secretion system F family protein [Natranaerobius thermophilus]ACB85304.1 type II secretion system protein [Natranaerobius thermophilus JW/NM-WN-LF]
MIKYYYRAKSWTGEEIKGFITADSRETAILNLTNENFCLIELKNYSKRDSLFEYIRKFLDPVTSKELMLFTSQFSTMVRCGIPVIESLDLQTQQLGNKNLTRGLTIVIKSLNSGKSLREAFSDASETFPWLITEMVGAGEESGRLDEILDRLALHYEQEYTLSQKLKSAISYPILLIILAMVVVYILLTVIFPQFINLFEAQGAELPFITRMIFDSGIWMTENFSLIFVLAILLMFLCVYIFRRFGARLILDSVKLKIPVFGDLVIKANVARLTRTAAMLLESGVPLKNSLSIGKNVVSNLKIRRDIDKIIHGIQEGQRMTYCMCGLETFPDLCNRLISVGEETGTLDETLKRIANLYERELSLNVKQITALIEPLMILIMSLIIGLLVLAVIIPVIELWKIF